MLLNLNLEMVTFADSDFELINKENIEDFLSSRNCGVRTKYKELLAGLGAGWSGNITNC